MIIKIRVHYLLCIPNQELERILLEETGCNCLTLQVEAEFQGLPQNVWQWLASPFEWFVTNSRGMDQDVVSLSLGWGKRRVIYDCDAEKRGSREIISVEGIIFRC
jgi:hypothetical protein